MHLDSPVFFETGATKSYALPCGLGAGWASMALRDLGAGVAQLVEQLFRKPQIVILITIPALF
jgi:hypothetical protein